MRSPYQTLTILYKRNYKEILYAIFYRKDNPIWQFISGGGEDNETPIETAIREVNEETFIRVEKEEVQQLDSISTIPVVNITGEYTWGKNIYVVPEYTFGINATDCEIKLSREHKQYKWVGYNEAMENLKYDSNKIALWELNERLKDC